MTADGSDRSFGAPRFDVVLRGYDRRQVDEHLSRLQRVLSRMRGDLEAARNQSPGPGQPAAGPPAVGPVGSPPSPGARPRPRPRPRPDTAADRDSPDVVGTFTERMQTILQTAEDEAAEIRSSALYGVQAEEERLAAARAAFRAEEERTRAALAYLLRQRDVVLADLTRLRGQLEALLSAPTARITIARQDGPPAEAARRDAGAGHPLPGTPVPLQLDAGGAVAELAGTGEGAGSTAAWGAEAPAAGPDAPSGAEAPAGDAAPAASATAPPDRGVADEQGGGPTPAGGPTEPPAAERPRGSSAGRTVLMARPKAADGGTPPIPDEAGTGRDRDDRPETPTGAALVHTAPAGPGPADTAPAGDAPGGPAAGDPPAGDIPAGPEDTVTVDAAGHPAAAAASAAPDEAAGEREPARAEREPGAKRPLTSNAP